MNELIGSVEKISVSLYNKDKSISLTDTMISVNIYEDIFSNFLTGKIVFKDTMDVQAFFPLVGNESIDIDFLTPGDKNPKSIKTYKIYKMDSDSTAQSLIESRKLIILYFCSPEMIENNKIKVSKRFEDSADTIIKGILKDYFKTKKELLSDGCDIVEVYSNFWKPTDIINFINKKNGKASDFLFFENKYGFQYKSLTSMLKENEKYTLEMADDGAALYGWNNILTFKMLKYFDTLSSLRNGVLGNTVYGIDKTYYEYLRIQNDNLTATEEGTSLGKNIIFDADLLNFSNTSSTLKDPEKVSLRDMIMKALMNYHIVLKLPGDSSKTVGEIVRIPIQTIKRDDIEENQLLTGNWIITNINHEILQSGKYNQNIKLVKNSLFNYKNHEKVKGGVN
jgi:hypothetical protein